MEALAVILLFNAGREAVDFDLPALPDGRRWHRKADTARPAPDDIYPLGEAPPLDQQGHYGVDPRSSAVLIAAR
jgi:glycogen operon protein